MQARRKPFRVETMDRAAGRANVHAHGSSLTHHDEIMSELRALRSLVKPSEQVDPADDRRLQGADRRGREAQGRARSHSRRDQPTKQEIATVHVTGFEGPEMARVTNELDAIVGGTESATDTILSNAEEIDQMASTLAGAAEGRAEPGARAGHAGARDQDLRGLQFPGPDRPAHHQGGRDAEIHRDAHRAHDGDLGRARRLQGHRGRDDRATRKGDARLLNGPKIEGEAGHASQDDIDALFA